MHKFKISVVIPSYNRARTLKRALASVASQTYPVYEVIVVDDCSTDDTEELVRELPDVIYMRMEKNSGAGASRNYGVKEAKGDWIAFLDSDDIWACNRLEEQVNYIEAAPDKSIGLVCCGITVQERSGNCAYYDFDFDYPETGWTFSEFQTYPFSTPTWLVNRAVFIGAGGFDESLPNCEDLDMLAKLTALAPIRVMRAPLVTKYNQADSIDADLKRIEESYQVLFERHGLLWEASPQAAANSQYRLGCLRLGQGEDVSARKAFRSAMQWRPVTVKYPIAWLLSFLGYGAFRRIARLVRVIR